MEKSVKNRIITLSLREIKNSFKRFLSLLIISMLGVTVFVGIKATAPDMMNSIDKYYDENNIYDIKLVSANGLTDEDISMLKEIKDIQDVEGTLTYGFEAEDDDSTFVVNYHSISDNINKIQIESGRLPSTSDEIVVQDNLLKSEKLKLGSQITIKDSNGIIKDSKLTIVGIVRSALYVKNTKNNKNLGSTSLGTGNINYYIYGLKDNFNLNIYTEIYATVSDVLDLTTNSSEYNERIEEIEKQIKERNNVYRITDRRNDDTYHEFVNDSESISNLAKLFPTLFFVIAIFISLVSMSRMVDDDRMEIGTLKSMGFSNTHIAFKYLLYSAIATIVGGVIGAVLGFLTIPKIIWNIYKILFDIPKFVTKLDMTYIVIGVLISFVCIVGVTLITVAKNLREKPSKLLRPKAPKKGKRVILEYIPVLWKHISFSNKVTIRNIFRYKARVFMTVFGVAGCTALLMAGFGFRDSIVNIPEKQYRDIFIYDDMLYFSPLITDDEIDTLLNADNIKEAAKTQYAAYTSANNNKNIEMTMVVPENTNDFIKIFNLRDAKTHKELELLDDEIIISDKMAQLMKLSVGDNISIFDSQNNEYTFTIGGICEQYVNHFVFINKNTYEKNIGQYNTNTAFIKTLEMTDKEEDEFRTELLDNDKVLQVTVIDTIIDQVDKMLTSLNYVVLILIIFAAALSFVVMYNLSNINIAERQREIATLKVLGFYNGEVDNYIIRENIILTLLGIAVGLIGGYFFTNELISTVEIETIRFVHHIKQQSYLYSMALALLFTIIVNVITHFSLKKIDMIESLKSVE